MLIERRKLVVVARVYFMVANRFPESLSNAVHERGHRSEIASLVVVLLCFVCRWLLKCPEKFAAWLLVT